MFLKKLSKVCIPECPKDLYEVSDDDGIEIDERDFIPNIFVVPILQTIGTAGRQFITEKVIACVEIKSSLFFDEVELERIIA